MEKRPDILFVNPPSAFGTYDATKVGVFKQVFPLLSFMSLSAALKLEGFKTSLLDLGIEANPYELLTKVLQKQRPRFVGITSATPLFFEAAEIARITRHLLGNDVKIIYGGPHATALPYESILNSEVDIIVISEGEETIYEILAGKKLPEIEGIYYKEYGCARFTPKRAYIKDLDSLPFPDFFIYDISRYHCAKLVSRASPVLHMETSRGCPGRCTFCNKNISGRLFRAKSAERVVEEIKYFLKNGAGEIRIIDDQFGTDINRAKKICELILKENLRFPWNLGNGFRVDRVDEELMRLLKRAGCYQVGFGFESGDQKSLDSVEKGIKLEQSVKAMEIVRKVGIETVGFFMIGLPADTEESLKKTIKFAKKLLPTFAKTTVAIPFPGSRLYEMWESEGRIKTRDWSKYNQHKTEEIYDHPNLTHEQLKKYYHKFYRSFYMSPGYLKMRIWKSLKERTFWRDVYYGIKTFVN